jgi:hypothetical protein
MRCARAVRLETNEERISMRATGYTNDIRTPASFDLLPALGTFA